MSPRRHIAAASSREIGEFGNRSSGETSLFNIPVPLMTHRATQILCLLRRTIFMRKNSSEDILDAMIKIVAKLNNSVFFNHFSLYCVLSSRIDQS